MRRHVGTLGGIAQFAKPISEAGRGVRLAEASDQECLDAHCRRRVDDLAQFGMYRNFEVSFIAAFGLALIDGQHAGVNVLTSHSHDVAAALAGVQQEREGEPRSGANRGT